MSGFDFLFFGRSRRDPHVESIRREAMRITKAHATTDEVKRVTQRFHATLGDLLVDGPYTTSLMRREVQLAAIAQWMSLLVWEHFGRRLPEQDCIALTQALVILELYQLYHISREQPVVRTWLTKVMREQVVATQASTPLVLCFMGQKEQARKLVDKAMEMARLPTDEDIICETARVGAG